MMKRSTLKGEFPVLLEHFFSDYLLSQRSVSPSTIASYRDTFRLLLQFLHERLRRTPSALLLEDLSAPHMLSFLQHLENERGNSVRSRNARLAAVRSFMHYASFQDPSALPMIRRVLAVPLKRFDRPSIDFLSIEEVGALLNGPDPRTWSGHRDRVLLKTLYNTGARVSEIINANIADFIASTTASLRIRGKGRKERLVPLWRETTRHIRAWLQRVGGTDGKPLFPNRRGGRLSRSGVQSRLRAAAVAASVDCPTLCQHRLSPHLLRHTTAMHLLKSGVDMTVIALWLGHESIATTHMYVEADLEMKKRAITKVARPKVSGGQYRPGDPLLTFLDSL